MNEKKWIKDGKLWNGDAIVLEGMRIWNPSEEQLVNAGYEEYTEPAQPEVDPVEEARKLKLAELDNYNKSAAVDSFTVGGKEMWLTVAERQQIATQINANEAAGRLYMTKWFDGIPYSFSIEEWKQMLIALEVYAGDALNTTETHRRVIKTQLKTVEEIQNYDYTQDYPGRLSFGNNNAE